MITIDRNAQPKLLDVYAGDGMTLDQLMGFTVSGDWERQEQVWERLQSSYTKETYAIRRLLTEGAVRASDKRARFIGEAYEAEGGTVLRDLFQGDDGGWLHLRKGEMAERAEQLLAGSGWLPEPLRTQGLVFTAAANAEVPHIKPEADLPDDPEQHEAEMPTKAWSVAAE